MRSHSLSILPRDVPIISYLWVSKHHLSCRLVYLLSFISHAFSDQRPWIQRAISHTWPRSCDSRKHRRAQVFNIERSSCTNEVSIPSHWAFTQLIMQRFLQKHVRPTSSWRLASGNTYVRYSRGPISFVGHHRRSSRQSEPCRDHSLGRDDTHTNRHPTIDSRT